MATLRYSKLDTVASMQAVLFACLSLYLTCVVGTGPCLLPPIVVRVSQPSDILLRLNYPPTTTVALQIDSNLTVFSSLLLNASFTCTILEPSGPNPVWITSVNDSVVPLRVWNNSNVLVRGLHFRIPFLNSTGGSTAPCPGIPEWLHEWICPAVMVYGSWGIQFTENVVEGRVDVFRGANSLYDSNKISMPIRYFKASPGALRVYTSGDPVNIIPCNITVSNNDISGNDFGVAMAYQTVGVTLKNNFIHNYTFFGVACGTNMHNIADCFLHDMTNNLVVVEPELQPFFNVDGAAFYFDTHWMNPGNVLSCNYVYGGNHCYYLDYCSSDVHVKGGVCIAVSEGVKLNTGKENVVESVLVTPRGRASYISCQNYFENNCNIGEVAQWWVKTLADKYWSPAWEKVAPFLIDFCAQTHYEWKGKVWECNPEVNPIDPLVPVHGPEVSGRCSGLPTGNDLAPIIVDDPLKYSMYFCNASTPTVPNMNSIQDYYVNHTEAAFVNYTGLDWAVLPGSPIFDMVPNFHSCPVADVGIQPKGVDEGDADVWNRYNVGAHVQEMLGRVAPPLHSLFAEFKVSQERSAYRSSTGIPELEKGLEDLVARQVSNLGMRMAHKQSLLTTKFMQGGYSDQQSSAQG